MTADAKIGLLLGLVFIFVIAFIINGLPNFGNRPVAEGAAITEFQDDRIGLVDNAQNAQEQLGWAALLEQEGDGLDAVESSGSDPDPVTLEPETAVATETGDARSVYELPSIESLVGGVSRSIGDVVSGLTERAATVVSSEVDTNLRLAPAQEEIETLADVIAPATRTSEPKPEPAKSQDAVEVSNLIHKISPKVYVVQKGDVLATVAKKAYGPEEGNRLVNINRIFEANRNVLKTPDEIFEGQKLVIPPLPQPKKDDALSKALFDKVEAIGKRNLPEGPKLPPSGRTYIVREDDSFWKFAASQLGSGTRWEEIAKLNGLKENSTLQIGTELKLPAK